MLEWDHNAYYHRWLLRQLPPSCRRALDVGCGAGAFAAQLAHRVERVDALDRSTAMIEVAKQRTPTNVNCVVADVPAEPLPHGDYDAIFSISALHHMRLEQALWCFAEALRPGGVLAVVALPRQDHRELPVELAATVGHHLFGAAFLLARSVGSGSWFARDTTHATMPVVTQAPLTTREVKRQASAVLPGVRVRRLVFWRYLLLWRKPPTPTRGPPDPTL